MRRIQPVKHVRSLINKERASVLMIILIVFFAAASLPSLHTATALPRQYMTLEQAGLYTIDDEYTNGHTAFQLQYPLMGQKPFDTTVLRIITDAKQSIVEHLKQSPHSYGALTTSYELHFHNDRYLSLSLAFSQSVDGRKTSQQKALLYDYKDKKIISLSDLFNTKDYQNVLIAGSANALKKQLGHTYSQKRVAEVMKQLESFIITKQQTLALVFPANTFDKVSIPLTVEISGDILRDVIAPTIANNVLKLPQQAQPEPPKSSPQAPVTIAPIPIPQADPKGVNCGASQCLALTFDDGPTGITNQLLDVLAANNARATFFILGMQAERYPEVTRRIMHNGHLVANHTYDHKNLEQLSLDDARGQIQRTNEVLERVTGTRPGLARAPYGAINSELAQAIGMPFINWSADTEDWLHRDAAHICNATLNNAHAGGIILLHDIHQTTVDAMRCVIPQLIQRGFILVTVPQLLSFGPGTPPGVYSKR